MMFVEETKSSPIWGLSTKVFHEGHEETRRVLLILSAKDVKYLFVSLRGSSYPFVDIFFP